MTTVAKMIEWMKTLPQDAVVECGKEVQGNYESYMVMDSVDIESCDVLDYTSAEDRAKYPNMAGKVLVMIRAE